MAAPQSTKENIIAARGMATIEFIDPANLQTLSSITVHIPPNSTGCCWLYAIDLGALQAKNVAGIWGTESRRALSATVPAYCDLFSDSANQARIVDQPVRVALPEPTESSECATSAFTKKFAIGTHLFVYEVLDGKVDRRRCPNDPGGAWMLDATTRRVIAHFASDLYFWQLVPNYAGSERYGITSEATTNPPPPGLVRIDSETGKLLDYRALVQIHLLHSYSNCGRLVWSASLVLSHHGLRKDSCAAVKAFSTAIFFLSLLSAEAFAQSTPFQQVDPLTYEHFNHSAEHASFRLGVLVYYQPMVVDAPTSQTTVPLIGHVRTSSTPPRLWSYFPSYGTPVKPLGSVPFAYRNFDHGTGCSGGGLEAFQIASCMGLLEFDRPALNRLQNVIVHVMRHYSSQEAVRVNRECVRSLSCSNLYEKSVVERMAVRPPK
ncbi:MAG: hypothetical protein JO138_03090 [Acidobacteriaceae bacterium]|nr:hypothetical protein [Acidobacteriaceae bacterium]